MLISSEFPMKQNAPRGCAARSKENIALQTASARQSGTSPSRREGFEEFEADLSALFL